MIFRSYHGMPYEMGVRKIAVSLPAELDDAVRRDARESRTSVSGWLADAAERKLRRKHARQVLTEFEARHGKITKAEMAGARRRWPG